MKKTKKMLALILALMMAFTTLVMPAMAAGEDEGIMPRRPWGVCPYCDRTCALTDLPSDITIFYENGCAKYEGAHFHTCYYRDSYTCPDHGTFYGPLTEYPC